MIIGIVSGYFNPLHQGHIEYINGAKIRCEYLIAIINNDAQVRLKGSVSFMDEIHRQTIVCNLRSVDSVVLSIDDDSSVCKTIELIKSLRKENELIFFNSGDRVSDNVDNREVVLCNKLGIKYVTLPLPKRYSSNELIRNAANKIFVKD